MSFYINDEIENFMTIYNKNQLKNCSFDNFNNFSNENKISFMLTLINRISPANINESTKNYKMEFYYNLLEFVVNNICTLYTSDNLINHEIELLDNYLSDSLLEKLTKLSKGQNLLKKLEFYIIKIVNTEHKIEYLLQIASKSGTFSTFLFWLNKTKAKCLHNIGPELLEEIYINSIGNSDDRLYKYILNFIGSHDKLFFQKKHEVIVKLIRTLACSYVPSKYQLKRLRFLSEQISLIPYFNDMIESFKSEKVLFELHKYYYVELYTYNSLCGLIRTLGDYTINGFEIKQQTQEKLMGIFKTTEEKICCQIIISLIMNNNFDFKVIDEKIMEKIIIENYIMIISQIDNIIKLLNVNNYNKCIIQILSKNNLITRFLQESNFIYLQDYKILFFTRFLNSSTNPYSTDISKIIVGVNYALHRLRLLARKKSKSKVIQRKVKMFNLLNEIKNFSPNKNITILSKGSHTFQQQKQKFTNVPPRHLLPGELSIYKNFLLKEKADGILINNLPIGIYPNTSIISNHQVKAEYIEELDLYLIFDIDIPNTTIVDRYNILRQAHPYTQYTKLQNIDNLNKLFNIMDNERQMIIKFMSENKEHPIKWYPKFACQYNISNKIIYNQLINQIILEKEQDINSKLKLSKPFNCDGIILTPLDGEREIKIKPKSLMTIDLLFNNKKWVDRNNVDWSHIIIKPKTIKKDGRIYRCYPHFNSTLQFTVGEYRYDKKYPNPFNVVDNIINILKYDWSDDFNDVETYYYDESKILTSSSLIKTIQLQNNLLEHNINKMEPYFNKNWLDLGCGRGKLVSIIKKYNPKSYLGLDVDIKQLVRALKIQDEKQNIYQFNPCDLSSDWKSTKNKWYSFNNMVKYDYIVANFSLMHFCTKEFWSQLNEIVNKDTKFMFNLVKQNESSEWRESNSFLKIQDGTVTYKFEWTHSDVKSEPFISENLINDYLKTFGWKVIDNKPTESSNSLLNFYSWWIVQRI